MQRYLYPLIAVLFAACTAKSTPKKDDNTNVHVAKKSVHTKTVDNVKAVNASVIENLEDAEEEFATYYVVVVDTGTKYYSLRDKMQKLHNALNIEIDTMGRYFNAKRNRIVLPDNDEDDIYAGDYYPRRTPSKTLSLEYMGLYKSGSKDSTIAIIAGLYERQSSADSAFKYFSNEPNAFVIAADLYQGCLH